MSAPWEDFKKSTSQKSFSEGPWNDFKKEQTFDKATRRIPIGSEEYTRIKDEFKQKGQLPYQESNRQILKGLEWAGEKYDRFLSSPMRASIGSVLEGEGPKEIVSKGFKQFTGGDQNPPSPLQLATKMGMTEKPLFNIKGHDISPAMIGALGINFFADPLLASSPVTKGAKIAGELGGAATKLTAEFGAEAANILSGTKVATKVLNQLQTTGRFGKDAFLGASEAFKKIFNPIQAHDFPQMAAIAEKYGINPSTLPESVEFGRGTHLDSSGRALREGLLGEKSMAEYQENYRKLQEGVLSEITQIGGGKPLSPIDAGMALRKSFDEGMKRFWESIDVTHNRIMTGLSDAEGQYILPIQPHLYVDGQALEKVNRKVNQIEKYGQGLAERGIDDVDRAQGRFLLNAVTAFRSANGSYKETLEALRSIGKKAFQSKTIVGQVPHDIEKMRELYFTIDQALIETVRKHVSPEFANDLIKNNKEMHKMFNERNQIGHILADKDIAPETAFKSLIVNGDSDQINALRKFITPEQMNRQKASFLNEMIKHGPDGGFSLKNLYNSMRTKKHQIENLFSDNPNQLLELTDILKLGDRFGNAVLSTSGTGASNVFQHLGTGFRGAVANESILNSLKHKARNPVQHSLVNKSISPLKAFQMMATEGSSNSSNAP